MSSSFCSLGQLIIILYLLFTFRYLIRFMEGSPWSFGCSDFLFGLHPKTHSKTHQPHFWRLLPKHPVIPVISPRKNNESLMYAGMPFSNLKLLSQSDSLIISLFSLSETYVFEQKEKLQFVDTITLVHRIGSNYN